MIPYNKIAELEDFSDPDLLAIIREVNPHDNKVADPEYSTRYAHRKHWETAMSVRTLRDFGALHRNATILGVGAGLEVTNFYLTNHVYQVFATDLYLNPGVWDDYAPPMLVTEPEALTPYPFDLQRLVVQHMDARILQYPDNAFDGIYSAGSIEHFGSLDYIANSAYEMGRVLKPGGVLTLSTEYKIRGPADGDGFPPDTYLLSAERIRRYIVEASGLELVDTFDTSVSEATLKTERNIIALMNASGSNANRLFADFYPHIALENAGYLFGSVHLAFRKPANYPVIDNVWAKPTAATKEAVNTLAKETTMHLLDRLKHPTIAVEPVASVSAAVPEQVRKMNIFVEQWDTYYKRANLDPFSQRLPKPLGSMYRSLLRFRYLGKAWDAQRALYQSLTENQSEIADSLSSTTEHVRALQERQSELEAQIQRIERRLAMLNSKGSVSKE